MPRHVLWGGDLFKVREDEDRELLGEEMAKKFHRTVAQLLFLCKRARPDIKTLVSFLTTRVKQPDKDDWGNLRYGLMYLPDGYSLHEEVFDWR